MATPLPSSLPSVKPMSLVVPFGSNWAYPEDDGRQPRLVQNLIDRQVYLNPLALTAQERTTGKVTLIAKHTYLNTIDERKLDIAEPLNDLIARQKQNLIKSLTASEKYETAPLLPVIKKALLKDYSSSLEAYRATYEQLKQTLPLVKMRIAHPIPTDFAHFYETDQLPRTIQLKGITPPKQNVCSRIFCRRPPQSSLEEVPTEFRVHEFVLQANHAGSLRSMINHSCKERETKEIVFQKTPNSAVQSLVQYLYFGKAKPQSDEDAQALFHVANQFGIDGLKPYCEAGAGQLDIRDGHPARLPSEEAVEKTLDDCETVEEAAAAAEQAKGQVKHFIEFYLDPHIQRAMQ